VSKPTGLHRRPLAETDVNLSAHPARIKQARQSNGLSIACIEVLLLPVASVMRQLDPTPYSPEGPESQVRKRPALATMLKAFVGERTSGWLFTNKTGWFLSQTNLLRRGVHPALKKSGQPKAGFRAFRRYRLTWLRKNRVHSDLERFWMGHENEDCGRRLLQDERRYRVPLGASRVRWAWVLSFRPKTPMLSVLSVKTNQNSGLKTQRNLLNQDGLVDLNHPPPGPEPAWTKPIG
jgi:hypothetical protein